MTCVAPAIINDRTYFGTYKKDIISTSFVSNMNKSKINE